MNVEKNRNAHKPESTTINVLVTKEPFMVRYGIFKYAPDKSVDITPIIPEADLNDIQILLEDEDEFINAMVEIKLTDFINVQNSLLHDLAKSLTAVRQYASKVENDLKMQEVEKPVPDLKANFELMKEIIDKNLEDEI